MKRTIVLAMLSLAAGCSAGLEGVWKGSGEAGEGHFYQFTLDTTNPEKPFALMSCPGKAEIRVPVCGLKEVEKRVEFRLDPTDANATCETARNLRTYAGEYGQDVITGTVVDAAGKSAGMFRAFRQVKD